MIEVVAPFAAAALAVAAVVALLVFASAAAAEAALVAVAASATAAEALWASLPESSGPDWSVPEDSFPSGIQRSSRAWCQSEVETMAACLGCIRRNSSPTSSSLPESVTTKLATVVL